MHDNRHTRSPVIITIALYGTPIAHIFIRVCALIYNGVSPSTFAHHLSHQYLGMWDRRDSSSRWNIAREFDVRQFMSRCSAQDNSAARPCCAGCTNGTTSGQGSLAARGQGPIGAHDFG